MSLIQLSHQVSCVSSEQRPYSPGNVVLGESLILFIATGTAEVGGWSTRELLSILDGLRGLKVVGGDVGKCLPLHDVARSDTCFQWR